MPSEGVQLWRMHTLRYKIRLWRLQQCNGQAGLFQGLQGEISDENLKVKVLDSFTLFGRADSLAKVKGRTLSLCEVLKLLDEKLVDGRASVIVGLWSLPYLPGLDEASDKMQVNWFTVVLDELRA